LVFSNPKARDYKIKILDPTLSEKLTALIYSGDEVGDGVTEIRSIPLKRVTDKQKGHVHVLELNMPKESVLGIRLVNQ